jgi:hypothetical protein
MRAKRRDREGLGRCLAVIVMMRARHVVRPRFYACGICGFWHAAEWDGDCRDDAARFTVGQLDILFPDRNGDGWPDWREVDVSGRERQRQGE